MLSQLITKINYQLEKMSATQILRLLHYAKKHIEPKLNIQLQSNPSLNYHSQEVETLELITNKTPTIKVTLNISGLFGACGIMPNHYTYDVLKYIKSHNTAMTALLDLLQNGMLTQLMQTKLNGLLCNINGYPTLLEFLLTLLGNIHSSRQILLPYLTALQQPHITATTLQWIISDYLQRPVEIIENSKRYQVLPRDKSFCIEKNSQLGINTIAGLYVRADHQHTTIRIHVKTTGDFVQLYHNSNFQLQLHFIIHAILGHAQAYAIDYVIDDESDFTICLGFSKLK